MEQYVHTIAQYGTLWHTMAHYGTVYHTVRPKIQTLSESPVISKYVLMTLQTEKSLRNVIAWCATNMAKWGIPEKNWKNVAQQFFLGQCNMFLADFLAQKPFLNIFPLIFPLIWAHVWGDWFKTFLSDFSVCHKNIFWQPHERSQLILTTLLFFGPH